MNTPCPTCRHYVLHLHELGATITTLRIAATRHRGLHGRLMHHITVGRRIRARYAEHRASTHNLALHLTEHAAEAAA